MRLAPRDPPRRIALGPVELLHVADVELGDDELVTFRSASGAEHDVVRKSWGYYATSSLNHRLPAHGLRPALCRGADGRTTLLLVERGHETAFQAYLDEQSMSVLAWMDGDPCPMCGAPGWERHFLYDAPPEGETRFELRGRDYRREVLRCRVCGHFVSRTELDLSALYEGEYMDSTYAGDALARTYERIMRLPAERSDNVARVARVVGEHASPARVLDIGSGLGVFPARMRDAGWAVTALDPDHRAVAHMRERVGVEAVQADFMTLAPGTLGSYELITLNKVLEHVQDPVAMLSRCAPLLVDGGRVYLELPDGEGAAPEGPGREEFFIEHLHVFSLASMALLALRAGFRLRTAQRLREPSGKYTLFAFCELP